MRSWIEKLAKKAKECGVQSRHKIKVDDLLWSIWEGFNKDFYITIECKEVFTNIKVYEDEYDLLKDANQYISNNTRDAILEKINNL